MVTMEGAGGPVRPAAWSGVLLRTYALGKSSSTGLRVQPSLWLLCEGWTMPEWLRREHRYARENPEGLSPGVRAETSLESGLQQDSASK